MYFDRLLTLDYLNDVAEFFPDDPRPAEYRELEDAIQSMNGVLFITITTTTAIQDEIVFEGLCRRFVHQLKREVLGKRENSQLPILVVIERGIHSSTGKNGLHAHIIIGNVIGDTRLQTKTTFRHFLSKQTLPAAHRILKRLTYSINGGKTGRIGVCRFEPVDSRKQLSDYLLKGLKYRSLNIAWMATTVHFQQRTDHSHLN